MIIGNLKELEERKELQLGDFVYFTVEKEVLGHGVRGSFLCRIGKIGVRDHEGNDGIFRLLKLDKYKLAEKAYGYKRDGAYITSSLWPFF